MVGPEYDPEKMVVMADIPPKLQALLNEGLDLIGVGCIKQNAQVVFGFFESFVIEYVIGMQVQGRDLRNLMQRNPNEEGETNVSLVPAGMLARSSLLGQDICGDNPRPEPEGASSEEAREDDSGQDQSEGTVEASASTAAKKKKKEYSRLQLLQFDVQDKAYLYLTVHVYRLVTPLFQKLLRTREKQYKNNEKGLLDDTARARMPWRAYKETILKHLRKGDGWHFLCGLTGLHRQNGEARRSWLQRIETGKEWSSHFNINLPDVIYVGLALRHTVKGE